MTGASDAVRGDVNLVLGPWPSDQHEDWTVRAAERHLDRFGLAFGLVRSSIAVTYDAAEGNARLLAELDGHPRLLPAFVLGPLESGEHGEPAVLPGALSAAGVRAVWLLPRRHGWRIDGAEAGALLDALGRARLPVFIELDEASWAEVDLLCAELPDVDVVVCGIGYRTLRQALPILDRRPRLHVDLSYTAAVDGLELLVGRYGADRLVMGTGAPVRDDAAPWFLLERSALSPADRAMIAGGTAHRLLGRLPTTPPTRAPAAASTPPPFIVDAHAHIGSWPSSWLPHPDADALLTALRRTGTRHAVISHLASIWGGDTPGGNAAALAATQAHPDELSVYLVANPNRPQDADLLREQLRSPHVRGVKVHPDTHDCPIDDARFIWVWRLALDADVPVLAHGFGGNPHSDPLLFGAVAGRFPELTLIVGHSGATVEGFRRTIEVGRRHPSLVAETCGSWMTGRWLRRLVDALGAARVLHGTDACLIDPRYGVGRVLGAGLSREEQSLVLGGNARRLLRLPAAATDPPPTDPHATVSGGH